MATGAACDILCGVNAPSLSSSQLRIVLLLDDAALRERWRRACAAANLCVAPSLPADDDEWSAIVLAADESAAAATTVARRAAVRLAVPTSSRPPDRVPPADSETVVDWDAFVPADAGEREIGTALRLALRLAAARRRLAALERSRESWVRLAECDPLTQLANRRVWDQAPARWIDDRGRSTIDVTCALFDLDDLKRTNDVRGHAAGDDVLRAAADALRRTVRAGDVAVRLGGDEFGALMPGVGKSQAADVAERVRAEIVGEMRRRGHPDAAASCGFAVARAGERLDLPGLTAAADAALLRAKQAGRDRTAAGVYSPAAS